MTPDGGIMMTVQQQVEEKVGHGVPVRKLMGCIRRWDDKPDWALEAILAGIDGSTDSEAVDAAESIEIALAARSVAARSVAAAA